ncbi:MAG: hypothetical protein Q9206_003524 [Seirophora lacunosa]
MPYHLLERPQQTKNILFQPSDIIPPSTRNRVRRSATEPSFTADSPAPSRHLLTRAPHQDAGSLAKATATAPTSPRLIGMLLFALVIIIFARACYIAYTARIESAASFGPRPPSRQSKKGLSRAKFPARRDSHDHEGLRLGVPAQSFGLNKRQKAPPPSLDLEAMKPQHGVKGEWRDLFPLAVPGTENVFMPARSTSRDGEDRKSARESLNISRSGRPYSAGNVASLTAEGLLERASTGVRGWMRGSRESLVSSMLGYEGGRSVLPDAVKDRDGDCVDAWQIQFENLRS